MWDHHEQCRFTLVWAADQERAAAREIVVRSLFSAFRGHTPRSEPASGFQLHSLAVSGVTYIKVLWHDARECKLRLLRYQIFEEYRKAVVEQRIRPESLFHFQLDSVMQGMPQQHITGRDQPFELEFHGDLDQLGAWIQQFD